MSIDFKALHLILQNRRINPLAEASGVPVHSIRKMKAGDKGVRFDNVEKLWHYIFIVEKS